MHTSTFVLIQGLEYMDCLSVAVFRVLKGHLVLMEILEYQEEVDHQENR